MLSTSVSAKRPTASGDMKRADRRSSIAILVLGDGRFTIVLLLCFCCLEMQKFRQSFRVRIPELADGYVVIGQVQKCSSWETATGMATKSRNVIVRQVELTGPSHIH
jgi:hypothetical protein